MRLEINCEDRLGITQDILDILTEYDIDLRGIQIDEGGKIFLDFPTIEFENFQHLMPKIRRIKGIDDVKTTPFMPIQRERNQLRALLQTLPDPCFSVDTQGTIILFNDAVSAGLELNDEAILALNIDDVLSGFNFHKWLSGKQITAQTQKVSFVEQDYIADILPVDVPDYDKTVLAGAVVILKSEFRLGAQMSAFNQSRSNSFNRFQAKSIAMKKLIREAKKMAKLDAHMVIYGETGVGKQEIAKACHQSSPRSDTTLLSLMMNTVSDQEAQTLLFGDTANLESADDSRLAPNNALPANKGILYEAQNSTLYIDEITEMSLELQAKFYRFMQHNDAGKDRTEKHLRVICSTSKDLAEMVQLGLFREDLYYYINVLALVVPPLRERKADIVGLSEKLLKQHSNKLGVRVPKLSKSCVEYLQSYPWPGNVRQLENALYRAMTLAQGNEISKDDIQVPNCSTTVSYIDDEFEGSLEQEVKKFEKDLLKRLYPSFPSTRQLAKKLGLSHTAIANKLREYGISKATVKY